MTKYAYLDRGFILHIVNGEDTAKEYSVNGKVVATKIEAEGGYPIVDGKSVIVYSLEEAYLDGNLNTGTRVDLNDYTAIKQLYKSVM